MEIIRDRFLLFLVIVRHRYHHRPFVARHEIRVAHCSCPWCLVKSLIRLLIIAWPIATVVYVCMYNTRVCLCLRVCVCVRVTRASREYDGNSITLLRVLSTIGGTQLIHRSCVSSTVINSSFSSTRLALLRIITRLITRTKYA